MAMLVIGITAVLPEICRNARGGALPGGKDTLKSSETVPFRDAAGCFLSDR
ncbi:MAG: hypothetical protein ACR2N0_00130 [Rubrobacteraceae bacterium]|jgi:hypothetical protein|nr:hypothetical protein [Rubrobacter sp.]